MNLGETTDTYWEYYPADQMDQLMAKHKSRLAQLQEKRAPGGGAPPPAPPNASGYDSGAEEPQPKRRKRSVRAIEREIRKVKHRIYTLTEVGNMLDRDGGEYNASTLRISICDMLRVSSCAAELFPDVEATYCLYRFSPSICRTIVSRRSLYAAAALATPAD